MSSSSSIKQLFKGIVIGVVLILAIIGSMSILDSRNSDSNTTQTASAPAQVQSPTPPPAIATNPPITINPISSSESNSSTPPITTADAPQALSPETEKPASTEEIAKAESKTPKEETKPEDESPESTPESEKSPSEEATAEDSEPEVILYGTLQLASIDSNTNKTLRASYQIFNNKDKKVAESKGTERSSIRLPIGQYKVISTLNPSKENSRETKPVESTQFITVRANRVTQKQFKMEAPLNIGVLQVSAKNAGTGLPMRADFLIQKEDGTIISNRKNVTNTLFKLKTGSYKVTVTSGENTDFRTVVVDSEQSTKTVFMLQKSYLQGQLLIRVFDTFSENPVLADISITSADGTIIQELSKVSKTEISLVAGNYSILVTGPNGQASRNINIIRGRAISEIFRFEAPDPDDTDLALDTLDDNIKPIDKLDTADASAETNDQDTKTPLEEEQTESTTGTLILSARSSRDQSPVKSNFYVQTLSGKHIAKKTYSESAEFSLEPGTYKITVRAKNRKNLVRTVKIAAGQNLNNVFSLLDANQQQAAPRLGGIKPEKNQVVTTGFLNIAMQPPQKAHFIVTTKAGSRVSDLPNSSEGRLKLKSGSYNVIAIFNGQRKTKVVQVRNGQVAQLRFNSTGFSTRRTPAAAAQKKGRLESRIVDQLGRAIQANLTVTDGRGRVVARANNVSIGVFNLPSTAHTITINYNGLKGSERVNIVSGETTVQTFTIAP